MFRQSGEMSNLTYHFYESALQCPDGRLMSDEASYQHSALCRTVLPTLTEFDSLRNFALNNPPSAHPVTEQTSGAQPELATACVIDQIRKSLKLLTLEAT
jgi:hypothetical protein